MKYFFTLIVCVFCTLHLPIANAISTTAETNRKAAKEAEQIAIYSFRDQSVAPALGDLYLIDTQGKELRRITTQFAKLIYQDLLRQNSLDLKKTYGIRMNFGLGWSPDGRYLTLGFTFHLLPKKDAPLEQAIDRHQAIYLFDSKENYEMLQLTPKDIALPIQSNSWAWAGDSIHFGYIESMDKTNTEHRIRLVNVEKKEDTVFTVPNVKNPDHITWTLENNKILFVCNKEDHWHICSANTDNATDFEVLTQGADSSKNNKLLIDILDKYKTNIDFSPDGKSIIFATSKAGENSSLYSINIDGTNLRLVNSNVGRSKWLNNGNILFAHCCDQGNYTLMMMDITGTKTQNLSSNNIDLAAINSFNLNTAQNLMIYTVRSNTLGKNLYIANIDGTDKRILSDQADVVISSFRPHTN